MAWLRRTPYYSAMSSPTSTDSDPFDIEALSSSRSRHAKEKPPRKQSTANKVDRLASTLQDTNKNLRAVDHLLEDYRATGEEQNILMGKLKADLDRTTEKLQEERYTRSSRESVRSLRPSDLDEPREGRRRRRPTSPLRDYERRASSDREYTGRQRRSGKSSPYRAGVRFFDDMDANGHLHGLHQSIRDIASGQLRMEDDLSREIDRRRHLERDSRRTIADMKKRLKGPSDSYALNSVDQRLQSIQDELRSERESLKSRQDEVGKISSELKKALTEQKSTPTFESPPTLSQTDIDARTRLLNVEAQKSQVELELSNVRRRLDQAEGGRNAMLDQIEDLRRQVARSDQEKFKLESLLDEQERDVRDSHRLKAAYYYQPENEQSRIRLEKEQSSLKDEVKHLRDQLSHSATAVSDYGELRKDLERSEKQRQQLSDHIQVLNKDVETKEKMITKASGQVHDLTEKVQTSEREKHQTLLQLEDSLQRLKDVTRESERLGENLQESHNALQESERKREEIKIRAQDTVKQWKAKCKKLEKEADRHQHNAQQSIQRNEQLIKELESLRSHTTSSGQQMEHLKRELGEILAMRAQQDEQLRLKDVEVNELRALKMDLERDLRDCKVVIERLEQELHSSNEKRSSLNDEKSKLEESYSSLQSSHIAMENQCQNAQKEMKEMAFERVEMSAQLAELAQQRMELKESLDTFKKGEMVAREEVEGLTKRLKEEKEFASSRIEALRLEADQHKNRETQLLQEISRRYKKDRAEFEAELQATKLHLQEEKSSHRLARKQVEKLKTEIDAKHKELIQSQDEIETTQRKYYKIKEEYISKTHLSEDGIVRAKELELELLDKKDELRRVEKDYQNILHSIGTEIDALLEEVVQDSVDAYKAFSSMKTSPSDSVKWLTENKRKLDSVRSELRDHRQKESNLRSSLRGMTNSGDADRQFFMQEIQRQSEILDRLQLHTLDNQEAEVEKLRNVSTTQIGELEDTSEQIAKTLTTTQLNNESTFLPAETDIFRESQRERDRIQERYAKLQETMDLLKNELSDTNKNQNIYQSTPKTSPKKTKEHRVTISSPPTHDPHADMQIRDERKTELDIHSRNGHAGYDSNDYSSSHVSSSHLSKLMNGADTPNSNYLFNGRVTFENSTETSESDYDSTSPKGSPAKTPPPMTLSDEEFARRFGLEPI